jgi:threonylcarbamoyladenosine tRNA methylthiotransferase MtaB
MSGRRVAVVTFGCKVNAYDGAAIAERLRAAGCRLVDGEADAEVVVANSCTITDAAAGDLRRLVGRVRRRSPAARVVVTGCHAQTSPNEVAGLPGVTHVVGLGRVDRLVDAVLADAAEAPRVEVGASRQDRHITTHGAREFPGQTRAFLKVQEGCDLFCTFCIVPLARGRSRSLPPRTVLAELAALAARGFEEVVLTGVHLGGYGEDLRPAMRLADLVAMLCERPLVPRLRLSSIDPHEIDETLLRVMVQAPQVCDHLHVPLQAGDDGVLRRMRRRYDTALARERLAMIRACLPTAAIGTDVIAGFPGEDDAAHARTEAFLGVAPITYAHVFPYSSRRGTTAAKFADHLPRAVVRRRAARLRALGGARHRTFLASLDGTHAEVLVERRRDPVTGRLRGYTRNYARVTLDGPDAWGGRRLAVRLAVGTTGDVTATVCA